LTIPRQKGETDLAVKEVKVEGRRYIVCRNEEEARKDAETRATLLADLQRKLASRANGLVGNTGYRRFLAAPEGSGFAIDTRQRPRRMRSSTACSSCAPACRRQRWPWCCAIATC
jgi:hypothetical protein